MSSGRRVSWMARRSLSDGFPLRGAEGIMGLFEEASDCVGQGALFGGVVRGCSKELRS